jgi:hypothetical protein
MRKIASLVAAASPRLDPVFRRREETTIAHEVNLVPSYQKLKGPLPEVRAVLRLHTRGGRGSLPCQFLYFRVRRIDFGFRPVPSLKWVFRLPPGPH